MGQKSAKCTTQLSILCNPTQALHGNILYSRWVIHKIKRKNYFTFTLGVQYLSNRSYIAQAIWMILVVLALVAAAIFAKNVFSDWQTQHTITSLKTMSKPVDELEFPSVTICKDGQNMHAVREALRREKNVWAAGKRMKRESFGSESGADYCQHTFNRTCEQVNYQYL